LRKWRINRLRSCKRSFKYMSSIIAASSLTSRSFTMLSPRFVLLA
jgi:hypothetical protein